MSAHNEKTYSLTVNGFSVQARFSGRETETVLDFLLDKIRKTHEGNRESDALRTIVYLSGPPGAGKSTLALSLIERAGEVSFPYCVQCLGLDGFHRRAEILKSTFIERGGKRILLDDIKGAPETFDAEAFSESLKYALYNKKAYWPVYDRTIHDVSDERISVEGAILIVEGNWLMMPGTWGKAAKHASLTISLTACEDVLERRLVERKIRGGKTPDEAHGWYIAVDGPNAERYLRESRKSDLVILETENGMRIIKNG